VPILKRNLVDWLSRGPWARSVLAFTSARPCDGGAGALYILLRRKRDAKKQVRVTEGAKW
jgi:DNA-nicking Smr family endonuclease